MRRPELEEEQDRPRAAPSEVRALEDQEVMKRGTREATCSAPEGEAYTCQRIGSVLTNDRVSRPWSSLSPHSPIAEDLAQTRSVCGCL